MCKLVEELCPNHWAGRRSSPHGEGSDTGLQIYLEDCLPICAFKGVLSLSDLEPSSELVTHNLMVAFYDDRRVWSAPAEPTIHGGTDGNW